MLAQKINTAGFLSEFLRRHELLPDRPFCWVLGSGASVQSGIPTGGALAKKWLEELHEMEDLENQPIEKWATAKNLGIKNFDFKNAATFYPWIYWRRFRKFREEGYAFLEKVMEDIEPSYGYSVLAQIMADKQHKAAITTNFDNLNYDEAESLFRESLKLGVKSEFYIVKFAQFNERIRANLPEANRFYQLGMEIKPNHEFAKKEYARFLKEHPEFVK